MSMDIKNCYPEFSLVKYFEKHNKSYSSRNYLGSLVGLTTNSITIQVAKLDNVNCCYHWHFSGDTFAKEKKFDIGEMKVTT